MSNIYIQEPPSSGKVLLKTTVGDIDIELWAKECPKTCRNFIQLCMEGYYNGTVFHRVVKGFIVQGGDPNGDGTGGESIYGHPFKDEFHSRLRFARRGLVGMANSGKDDNGSQFFFTMGQTPELQNKHTLFGKVTGDTIFNMLKLEEGLVDQNERPMYPQKIIRTEILSNPFEDIIPRAVLKEEKKEKKKTRQKGVKNFGLLSFGEEAEEDEEESSQFVQKSVGKAKSLHDVVDDPKLSKEAIKVEAMEQQSDEEEVHRNERIVECDEEKHVVKDESLQKIKNKLKSRKEYAAKIDNNELIVKQEDSDSEADILVTQEEEKRTKSEKRKEQIRQEIMSLKKQYQTEKKTKDELLEQKITKESTGNSIHGAADNELIKNFIEEKEKYGNLKAKLPMKGAGREDFTLKLLSKFRAKLDTLKQKQNEDEQSFDEAPDDSVVERDIQGDDWLAHTLKFEDKKVVLAKDASTKGDDWYDAYDPRNPLNKRKRGEVNSSSKDKSSKRSR